MEESICKQIVIDYTHTLTRIGVMVDKKLISIYLDSPLNANAQNRIVVGQVEKVVKNLQAAFVAFGEEKNGLLHFKQVPPCYQNKLQQGARIPVQIKKENTGDKGHKLTSLLNIQGYYLVCMVFEPQIRISKKIKDPLKRNTIKEHLEKISEGKYGFMVRTKAQDVPIEVLQKEAIYLMEEASKLMETKDCVSRGSILLKEDPLYFQVVMDTLCRGEKLEIICNDEFILSDLQRRLTHLAVGECIEYRMYPFNENLFKLLSYEKLFENTGRHKIWLKNGGNIVIDYTEAMTVIDVNSAKAVLSKNHQKAVMELNKLAVEEAILQVLQRNLAGMIIIDLVELNDSQEKKEIFEFAKELILKYDKDRMMVYPVTELGLMQITRTKKYASVPDLLGSQCPRCHKKDSMVSTLYKVYEIEQELKHLSLHTTQEKIYLYCSEAIYQMIQDYGWHEKFVNTYKIAIFYEIQKSFKDDYYEIKYHNA